MTGTGDDRWWCSYHEQPHQRGDFGELCRAWDAVDPCRRHGWFAHLGHRIDQVLFGMPPCATCTRCCG